MIVVADASVLVAELLRVRGRELLADPHLRVVVAEEQRDETTHELSRRLALIVEHMERRGVPCSHRRPQPCPAGLRSGGDDGTCGLGGVSVAVLRGEQFVGQLRLLNRRAPDDQTAVSGDHAGFFHDDDGRHHTVVHLALQQAGDHRRVLLG